MSDANGHVRLRLPYHNYLTDADLEQLADDIRTEGFDVEIEPPPALSALSPWDALHIIVDEGSKVVALAAVVKKSVDWARRRWRSKKDKNVNLDHLLIIYGPDGEVLKRMYVEGEEAHELSTDREVRKAEKRAWKRRRSRQGDG